MNSGSRRIIVLDTTLRDGDQSPGYAFFRNEKIAIARMLDAAGVDIIEAGFPASSAAQCADVEILCETIADATVSVMARAHPNDITAAARSIRNARRGMIHTSIATSPLHRKMKLGMNRREVLTRAVEAVRCALHHAPCVEIGAEDASRTEIDFLVEFCAAVTDAGAAVVNISDTVGFAQPAEFARLVRHLHEAVPAFAENNARISVHCHNDLGLAVANTLAGIEGGASQIEVTIGGVGERAGNAALEEIAAALDARRDYYDDVHLNYETKMTARLAALLASITGVAPRVSAPVTGWNSFAHASGIHQDGMRAHERMYSVLEPTHFGYRGQTTALSRHSGRSGLRTRAEELGIALDDAVLDSLSTAFKRKADTVRSVGETEFIALLAASGLSAAAPLRLDACERVEAANGLVRVRIRLHDSGHVRVFEGEGALWSDAVIMALRGVENDVGLVSFAATQVAVAGGVRGRGCAEIEIAGERMRAEAQDDDPATALARCIIDVINIKRCRRTP